MIFVSMKTLPQVVVISFALSAFAANRGTDVVVLCTLHQMHEETHSYSYADLSATIERLHPDVLAVELTPSDLAARVTQKNKREYQNSVYPLLQQHKWTAVGMEPEGPRRAELLAALQEADEALERDAPQKAEAFQIYVESLLAYLRSKWLSPADVNAAWTDDVFAIKHAFQNKLYGPKEEKGWEGWNQYFLDEIVAAANANSGKRVVVLVGAEHGYWMRAHLRNVRGVNLLDVASMLQQESRAAGSRPVLGR
jgi:subtilisin family serine protease